MHLPPDWGIFGTLVASFLVFWFLFSRIFFAPFLRLISEREQRLNRLNEQTSRLLNEEKAAVARHEAEIAEVRRENLLQRERERRAAQEQAAHLLGEARGEARAEMDKVRAEMETEFAAAARQLEELAQTLALELAGRLLERPIVTGDAVRLNS